MRLFGKQLSALARRFRFAHVAAVIGKNFVERVENTRGVFAPRRHFGGQVDKVDASLCRAHGDKLVQPFFIPFRFAFAAAGTGGAQRFLQFFAQTHEGVAVRFFSAERAFDFTEERGNFVKLFADGASVAVDGDARKRVFAVKKQRVFGAVEKFIGNEANRRGGNHANKQRKDDSQYGLTV